MVSRRGKSTILAGWNPGFNFFFMRCISTCNAHYFLDRFDVLDKAGNMG